MRIVLSNPRNFFAEILSEKPKSLRKLSEELGVNYSSMKKYRSGELAIPEPVFEAALGLSSRRGFWMKNLRLEDDSWGMKKGGSVSAKKRDMGYVRSFRRIAKPRIRLSEEFCEFYGALLGDGCISAFKDRGGNERMHICLVGNKRLDSSYFKYLKDLAEKEFGVHAHYYDSKNANTCRVTIISRSLALALNNEFGVPIGPKYGKLRISKGVMELPWNKKRLVIRGLLDTDGCVVANKREHYKYPWVAITSKDKKFLVQIKGMLIERRYPAYISGNDVCVRGTKNLKAWFEDIGSSNPRNLAKYEYFLKNGFLPAKLLN